MTSPPEWRQVQLHEVCSPKQWQTIKKSDLSESGYPVYGANGVIGRYHSFNHLEPTILIGCRGSCGVINVSEPEAWVTGNAMSLDDLDESQVDFSYMVHALEADGLQDAATGTSQPQITQTSLKRIRIPLPPLEEQRRIAAVLDAADELRAKRRQALAKLDTLTQAIFIDMFGDPLNPGRLGTAPTTASRLGDLAHVRTGKLDANASSDAGRYPFFTCAATPLRIDEAAFDTKAILVAGNGDLNVKYYEGKFNAYQRTYVIDSLDEEAALPRFLHGFLDIYVGRLREQAIGGVIKYIKLGNLTDAEVPLPRSNVQAEYVSRVEALELLREASTRSLARVEAVFGSLQQRAFRGEL